MNRPINPTYNNRVRFKLLHDSYGQLIAKEPTNWRSVEPEVTRASSGDGIFPTLSEALIFTDNAADYLQLIREALGVKAQVLLIIEQKHPQNDKWETWIQAYLDFRSYSSIESNKVSINMASDSKIFEAIKSRESTEVEIERTETLGKKPLSIEQLPFVEVPLTPRKIFLQSNLESSVVDEEGGPLTWTTSQPFNSPPLNVVINSDQERIIDTAPHTDQTYFVGYDIPANPNGVYPQNQQFFYYKNDREKKLNLFFDFHAKIGFANGSVPTQVLRLEIQKSLHDLDAPNDPATPVELKTIHQFNGNGGGGIQEFTFSNTLSEEFILQEGESLAFILSITEPISGGANYITLEKNDIRIEEDSFFEATTTKAILAHELGQRLTEIITGKSDAFYSEALGRTDIGYSEDGPASLLAVTHGMWIRGFDKDPEGDIKNKYKPIKTSFKEFIETISGVHNLSWGIEKKGFTERVRVEEKSFFYNKNITIKLPRKPKSIKRSEAPEYYHSKLEIGYDKGGEYEEAMGLDEYNAKSTFSTTIDKITSAFEIVLKYRADKYGLEFCRRKPKKYYPNEDTKYDQDKFILDLKRFFNSFKERLWSDDFEQLPSGVYSPETATNLRFSPVNILLRHGWEIATGLIKYPQDYIVFGSSTANAKLKTKLNGKPEFAENGDIQNSQLPRARFAPEWIEFEHPIDHDIAQQINGRTQINGKWIQNHYGMVEFINENNKKEYGFLFQVKFSEKGTWKLLKVHI